MIPDMGWGFNVALALTAQMPFKADVDEAIARISQLFLQKSY